MTAKVIDLDVERGRRASTTVSAQARVLLLTWMNDQLVGAGWVDCGDDEEPRVVEPAEARHIAAQLLTWAEASGGA